ncbi:uncharacterized protein LOC112895895 [Panicum hallii]|uniref:uncharacterized protein LOC112895895 n=1 Tax=Panicum hallii TaxID=206008 RepID=UPI000DF4CF24|nr:uncharacterized protein LOC112895895 [Panicum hallii]
MDGYPMPVADLLVDTAVGHKVISFMDGNAGYNQIFMAEEDIHKTTFRCPGHVGLYEWIVMTFGLKNAGATYQRAMNYIFHELIGKIVEIYIDDVVVKSVGYQEHLVDLHRTLECTRKHGLKMKPNKCAFGVSAGQFLGFIVHERGIEISQKTITAINKVEAPKTKVELQSFIGKINFIRRFISNLSGKILLFSSLLKLKADQEFVWGEEQQKVLDGIKHYLTNPPVLVLPQRHKPFKLYLSADEHAIGSALIQEFEEFDLRHESAKAVKGQVMADFVVQHCGSESAVVDLAPWTLFFDGSSCGVGSGISVVLISPRGATFKFSFPIEASATNNQAKYRAILKGIRLLKEIKADVVEIFGDSMLVVNQLIGEYECKDDILRIYHEECLQLLREFKKWVEVVPLKKVTSKDMVEFVKEHIIYRFGVPQTITTDQGTMFISGEFEDFAASMGIKLLNSCPYYAHANGQAEASNKGIIKLIKRKIDEQPRRWHTTLSESLWAYRMACHGATKVSPYHLVYGHEAVLPWDFKIGSKRVMFQDQLTADEYLALTKDELED